LELTDGNIKIIYHGVEPDALLEHIIGFITPHPGLTYGVVFLILLSEYLTLVGLLALQKK
jgi:hypothetical protein